MGGWGVVGGVICLVNSVNERDLSLLNNVVNDFSLAAFLRGTWNYQIPGRVRQQQVSLHLLFFIHLLLYFT